MDAILQFLNENVLLFIIASLVILFAIIGYFADKKGFLKKKKHISLNIVDGENNEKNDLTTETNSMILETSNYNNENLNSFDSDDDQVQLNSISSDDNAQTLDDSSDIELKVDTDSKEEIAQNIIFDLPSEMESNVNENQENNNSHFTESNDLFQPMPAYEALEPSNNIDEINFDPTYGANESDTNGNTKEEIEEDIWKF